MPLLLDFDSGFVSAIYFVFLDLVLLTTLDAALARFLSWMYYRAIFRGGALKLSTVDVPGVTTFLVGRPLAAVNLLGLCVKLAFVGLVLFLDLHIRARVVSDTVGVQMMSTFGFDPSAAAFPMADDRMVRFVERRWEQSRLCYDNVAPQQPRSPSALSNIVKYYPLAFNLTNDHKLLQSEILPLGSASIAINDSTLLCLRPKRITPPVPPLATVLGCSPLVHHTPTNTSTFDHRTANTSCRGEAPLTRNASSISFDYVSTLVDLKRYYYYNYSYTMYRFQQPALHAIFPEYASAAAEAAPSGGDMDMHCLGTEYYVSSQSRPTVRRWCLVALWGVRLPGYGNATVTLFERWAHDMRARSLVRLHRGPVFEGVVDAGSKQKAVILWNSQLPHDWVEFSGVIIADALTYRFQRQQFQRVKERKTVTLIPDSAIIVLIVMTVAVVAIRATVLFAIDCRYPCRPQLNTVDGISSIGREERSPSDRSLSPGPPCSSDSAQSDGSHQPQRPGQHNRKITEICTSARLSCPQRP